MVGQEEGNEEEEDKGTLVTGKEGRAANDHDRDIVSGPTGECFIPQPPARYLWVGYRCHNAVNHVLTTNKIIIIIITK